MGARWPPGHRSCLKPRAGTVIVLLNGWLRKYRRQLSCLGRTRGRALRGARRCLPCGVLCSLLLRREGWRLAARVLCSPVACAALGEEDTQGFRHLGFSDLRLCLPLSWYRYLGLAYVLRYELFRTSMQHIALLLHVTPLHCFSWLPGSVRL